MGAECQTAGTGGKCKSDVELDIQSLRKPVNYPVIGSGKSPNHKPCGHPPAEPNILIREMLLEAPRQDTMRCFCSLKNGYDGRYEVHHVGDDPDPNMAVGINMV